MAVDWQYGKVVYICSECEDDLETDERSMKDAASYAKDRGWLIFKDDDDNEWVHLCKECK